MSAEEPVPGEAPRPPARAAASPRPAVPPPPLIVGSGARHSVELGGGKGSVATRRVNQRAAVPEGEAAGPPFAPLAVPPMPAAEAAAARHFESLPEPASPRPAEQSTPPPAVASPVVAPAVDAAAVDAPSVDAAPADAPAVDAQPVDALSVDAPAADTAPADAAPPASDAFARRLQALRETTRQRRTALERLQRR